LASLYSLCRHGGELAVIIDYVSVATRQLKG
jgi:hypothetical protein